MYLFYTHHVFFFFFNDTATTEIYTLSLHDALPISLILSLPLILNSADYQALLISQAQDQLGRKVEMKRAHVEVFPYVRMTLDDVVIREADGQDEFLSTEHLFIDLRIFPLLKRKEIGRAHV